MSTILIRVEISSDDHDIRQITHYANAETAYKEALKSAMEYLVFLVDNNFTITGAEQNRDGITIESDEGTSYHCLRITVQELIPDLSYDLLYEVRD